LYQYAHKEMDAGEVRMAYEKIRPAFQENMAELVPLASMVPQAKIIYINEEIIDPVSGESKFETHCFVSCMGP